MSRRYRRRHPAAAVILAGTVVLVGLDAIGWALWLAWHLLPLVLGLACVWLAYQAGRRQPVGSPRLPKVIQSHAEDGEVIRLRAEVEALRAERDQTSGSARACPLAGVGCPAPAWGSTSAQRRLATVRDRLLADPRSGVHDVFGGAQ